MAGRVEERNWLLQQVEPAVLAAHHGKLKRVSLERGEVLHHQGDGLQKVYFPEGALIGLVSTMPAGDSIQTSMVGWDGALGVFEACGSRKCAFMAEVQVPGEAWSLAADDYRRLFDASEALRTAVHKYVEILLTEARQFVACNALHSVEGRLSRSILEALERSRDGQSLPVTQDALGQMLGVQRTTVSSTLSQLQAAGVVRTVRGAVIVQDRQALEQTACCCRETLQLARTEIYASDETVCDS